ncbi:hypothetical protein ACFY2R_29100 [Micromonospora olivasterospora]|uniref:Uncharacterized protein n=1 Tax=Micromonospora olivasterospora TaxID=1880 RepID=A0A562I526_MICOL|nr:hypothetical protein [Micromonospora olivasterospora]TWH65916.1 hypothetical protein JD77_00857 [Micromonospora olivasterospora]
MSTTNYAYHYAVQGRAAVPPGRQTLDHRLLAHADERLQRLSEVARDRPAWAQDLLQLARAVYLADKFSLRAGSDDGWTRRIDLSVQVTEPDLWAGQALTLLTRVVETLTADRWAIEVFPGADPWPQQGRLDADPPVEEVALFSGGLDSSAYAAERARLPAGGLLLVSYHEPQWAGQQERVLRAIGTNSGRASPPAPEDCCTPPRPSSSPPPTTCRGWPYPRTVSSRSTRR